eukprot:IDg6590t1
MHALKKAVAQDGEDVRRPASPHFAGTAIQSDIDFPQCADTTKYTYRNAVRDADCLVSQCTRITNTVVTSTEAAEPVSASNEALERKWLRNLASEFIPDEQQLWDRRISNNRFIS